MLNILKLTLGFCFLVLASADFDFDVPRCAIENKDPATGFDCTQYGYDAEWHIDVVRTPVLAGASEYFTVNGSFPPPTITVKKGQRIRIKLVNNLPNYESITLHFHGILQKNGYVVMDGPQGLTQRSVCYSNLAVVFG